MRKILQAVAHTLFLWLGLCGALASIYAVRNDVLDAVGKVGFRSVLVAGVARPSFYITSAIAFPAVILLVRIRLNLAARGHVSFHKFLRRFNPLVFGRVCIQLHRLEHIWQDTIHFVRDRRKSGKIFQQEDFKSHIYDFLTQCKYVLDLSTGDDVAVHIKLFEHRTKDCNPRVPLKSAVLKAYVRAPSRRECSLVEQQKMRPRENEEAFRILRGTAGLASRMIDRKEKLDKARYRYCSGYNHVFADPEHFFLCNDLPGKAKQKRFYSSSTEYEQYYRSAGVFLIHQHLQYGQTVNHEPVWGLLVVDSYATGVFEKFMTKFLAGYMAHRVYDIFTFAEQIGAVTGERGET